MKSYNYDAKETKPMGGFRVAPAGTYHLAIQAVTEKSTSNGDVMWSVQCEIDDQEYLGTKVWHNVTLLPAESKGAGMLLWFLKCIGEPHEGKFKINPDSWIDKRFLGKLIITEYKGREKNDIANVEPDTSMSYAASAAKAANGTLAEEPLPF